MALVFFLASIQLTDSTLITAFVVFSILSLINLFCFFFLIRRELSDTSAPDYDRKFASKEQVNELRASLAKEGIQFHAEIRDLDSAISSRLDRSETSADQRISNLETTIRTEFNLIAKNQGEVNGYLKALTARTENCG